MCILLSAFSKGILNISALKRLLLLYQIPEVLLSDVVDFSAIK